MTRVLSRTCLLLPLVGSLVACESTEPMSHPFQSVPAPVATVGTGTPDAVADARFTEFDEPFTMSSEEMVEGSDDGSAPAGPTKTAPPATDGAAAPVAAPPAAAVVTLAPTTTPAPTAVPALAPLSGAPLGWAVRLVTTVPNAQPPRAILGLPGGEEIVVTPGSMVPDAGLVVLSIGPDAVQLARVQASGDHADVEAFTVAPQYR